MKKYKQKTTIKLSMSLKKTLGDLKKDRDRYEDVVARLIKKSKVKNDK